MKNKNPDWNITAQEYYDKYYDPGSYHWESSGRHAYAALLKSEKRRKLMPKGDRVEGLSKEKVKCYMCNKNIKKHEPIIKIDGVPFHSGCAPKKG